MDFAVARQTMVTNQIRTGAVNDPLVIEAISAVPREFFVPAARRGVAYVDEDLGIGNGRYAMEPLVLARLLQLAEIQPTDRGLVVGAGSGYCAAVLARMAKSVIALESDRALADTATGALAAAGGQNVEVVTGTLRDGHAKAAPYDVILLGGGVAEVPDSLKRQLGEGGRLVAVVRNGPIGRGVIYERAGQSFGAREGFDAVSPLLPGFEKQAKFVF